MIFLNQNRTKIKPLCPVFGGCGGCDHQDISYRQELAAKNDLIKKIVREKIDVPDQYFEKIVASPQEYHYRHRIDLKLVRSKDGQISIGFSPKNKGKLIPVDECFIARKEVSAFIPELKALVTPKLSAKYRQANIVVKTGDDGRVLVGGVGRRSLSLSPDQYLWTSVCGRKIFYSLDTFFQANHDILPKLFKIIKKLPIWMTETVFLDLYGGVGLFSIGLNGLYSRAILIEDCKQSIELARYNRVFHRIDNLEIIEGSVEDKLKSALEKYPGPPINAMIDPPRAGLTAKAAEALNEIKNIKNLLYLSCSPESLTRDLAVLTAKTWEIKKIIPFDFFPKTRHLETLVYLVNRNA